MMSSRDYLQKFMSQQAGLSVTPLLEQGLVAATGPGNTWALTELGLDMLNGEYATTSFAKEQTAQQELVNAQARVALDHPAFEVEHSEHYLEKDRNGPKFPTYDDYAAQQESLNAQARAALEADWTSDFLHKHVKPGALSDQIGGGHYKDFPIQPVEFIEKNNLSFLEGCIIKRICRYDQKNAGEDGVVDLRKAIHEIRLLLQLRYGVSE